MHERFYTTAELARICGVSISTIKRWTDAGLLRCVRTPGGHRKFRLQDVADAARRLETSMVMPDKSSAARYDELTLLLLQQSREALAGRVTETLSQGDGPGTCRWLLDLHRHGMAAHRIAGEVLWSAFCRVAAAGADDYGLRRARGLAEDAVRQLSAQFPPPDEAAPRALLAQLPGGSSTLWLGFARLVLREAGWHVVDLGSHVPLPTLRLGAAQERPELVVLSLGATEQQRRQRDVDMVGTAVWFLHESAASLAGLTARLRLHGQERISWKEPTFAAADGETPASAEIFPLSQRLS